MFPGCPLNWSQTSLSDPDFGIDPSGCPESSVLLFERENPIPASSSEGHGLGSLRGNE